MAWLETDRFTGMDRVEHDIDLRHDFVVPEPQDPKASVVEPACAGRVRAGVPIEPMVTAIDLDHELGAKAGKVRNIRADRRLSSKMRPFDRHTLEMPPQALFGVGHTPAQCTGSRCPDLSSPC